MFSLFWISVSYIFQEDTTTVDCLPPVGNINTQQHQDTTMKPADNIALPQIAEGAPSYA